MQWTDSGVVLSARPFGDSAAVVTLLTEHNGRHAGLVHGARTAARRGFLQCGTLVSARWSARLADHLGRFDLEPQRAIAAALFDDADRLAGLTSAAAVAERALAERQHYPGVYGGLLALIDSLAMPELGDAWMAVYLRWELNLLQVLGYGLDLSRCAVTGERTGLAWVSPRTGRAVTVQGAGEWTPRLLRLPGFLAGEDTVDASVPRADLAAGLDLTGHFLARHVFAPAGQPLPPARERLAARFAG